MGRPLLAQNSSPSDRALGLSLVPRGGHCSHRIAHLVTEHLGCLGFHGEAIAVMGLIRLIYIYLYTCSLMWAGMARSVQRVATGWMAWGSDPSRGRIFRTHPDWAWDPPSLLYNGYQVSFPGVKRPGRDVDHPPSSCTEVKERVELYLYCSPAPESSWPVLG